MKVLEFQSFRPHFIAIEGPIGVGKTTLARILAERWEIPILFEEFEDNPFLTKGFYEDPEKLGFNTEVFFLLSRYEQWKTLNQPLNGMVLDYCFDKGMIFANMNLKGDRLEIFQSLYQQFKLKVPSPSLVIYLQAEVDTLMRRIHHRDRQFERVIRPEYLSDLSKRYQDFFAQYSEAPVISIKTDQLDIVNNSLHLNQVISKIEEHFLGYRQLSLKNFRTNHGVHIK